MALSADDYLSQLQALLPSGAAWTREADAVLTQLLHAQAEELARVDGRAEDLLRESDPRTTSELLPDWERVAGLPDTCVPAAQTLQERRDALVTKLTNPGGQSHAFFIALAARLGYTVTITEFPPFEVGLSGAGDEVGSDDQWRFVWRVNGPETTVRVFRAGSGRAGEPLRKWGNELLECVLNRYKPAHTNLLFGYGLEGA